MTDPQTTTVANLPNRAQRRRAEREAARKAAQPDAVRERAADLAIAADPEPAADEPEKPAGPAPLDPYASHEIRFGRSRVLDPKTKVFVDVLGIACSCGRLGRPIPNRITGELFAQMHALEIGIVRLAWHAGIDLDAPPSEFEKLAAGHGPTLRAFHERIAEQEAMLAERGGQLGSVDRPDGYNEGMTTADTEPES